jgi:hypothetical protein
MRGLANRRAAIKRAKARARHKIKHIWALPERLDNETYVGRVSQQRQPCSCFGCGNPRRHLGNAQEAKTMAERRMLSDTITHDVITDKEQIRPDFVNGGQ